MNAAKFMIAGVVALGVAGVKTVGVGAIKAAPALVSVKAAGTAGRVAGGRALLDEAGLLGWIGDLGPDADATPLRPEMLESFLSHAAATARPPLPAVEFDSDTRLLSESDALRTMRLQQELQAQQYQIQQWQIQQQLQWQLQQQYYNPSHPYRP